MAYTLSRYLRLRLDDNLTANSRYNLQRIDLIGAQVQVDSLDQLRLRSRQNIEIEPNSEAVGGSGTGGTVSIGTSGHSLSSVEIYASQFNLRGSAGLLDQAAGGNKYLRLRYRSDVAGSPDTASDRILSVDLGGGDRSISVVGDISTTGTGNLSLSLSGNTSLVLPTSGTLLVSGSVVDVDVSPTAAIARSKIANGTPSHIVVNDGAGVLSSTPLLDIPRGGTGATSANAALNNLLPPQTGNANFVLTTDGSNSSWLPAGNGTVTSVGLTLPSIFSVTGSPVTTSGTLAASLATQSVGSVWAGPATGPAAAPSFRALVFSDLPSIDHGALTGLGDDDHTQYHTDSRALTWLGTRSTSDLPEGSNLYYTNTRFDTQLATKTTGNLTEGSNLYYTDTRFDNRLATKTTADLAEGSNLYYTDSRADARITAQKAVADGLATLDSGGKIPASQLPSSVMSFLGNWNAAANTPALVDGIGDAGDVYRVSVAGTQNLGSGSQTFAIGDWVMYSGSVWQLSKNSDAVASVNGFTGIVVLDTDDIFEGTTNLYYTDSRADARIATKKTTTLWIPGDGTTRVFVHGLGTEDVSVNLYNVDTGEEIWPDTIIRNSVNQITCTSSEAPSGTGWRIIVRN